MERTANNGFKSRGGKHEPVDLKQHERLTETIKAKDEVEKMLKEERAVNYDNVDEILGVIDSGRRKSSQSDPYERISAKFNEQMRQSKVQSDIDEMRRKSLSGNSTSNKRTTSTISNTWRKAAISATLAAAIFIGGVKFSDQILERLEKYQKEWELNNDTKEFSQMIEADYTTKTFTGDTQIEYDELAEHLESDGIIDNRELYTMVAALGEVQANEVLNVAENAPAENVEDYMRSNNITSTEDWRTKTAQEMVAQEHLNEAQAELDAIFKDTPVNINATEGTYGGK